MKDLADRLVLVLGIGESGLAMTRWCARVGARLRVADSRVEAPLRTVLAAAVPAAEVVCGAFSEELLEGVDLVAKSPGVDSRDPLLAAAAQRGIPVVGEMALFATALETLDARESTRIVAITGTNGKSTTTALTTALLIGAGFDATAVGNISPAALAELCDRLEAGMTLPQCWVLELSSFQLEHVGDFRADVAVVLNVSNDHLDRHGDLTAYGGIKAGIYAGDGVQVINRDDARVAAMACAQRRVIRFGATAPQAGDFGIVEYAGQKWLAHGDTRLLAVSEMPIAGHHNALNALAALALGTAVNASMQCMIDALKTFRNLPHRVEPIARRTDGVLFYDDSKGTNVGAAVAALEGLGRPVVLIAGGDAKGQDFYPLAEAAARHARAVVLIGQDAPAIAAAMAQRGVPHERAENLLAAVERANVLAQAGDAVLLSPACASFDMFHNYIHRAEVFGTAVRTLPEVQTL